MNKKINPNFDMAAGLELLNKIEQASLFGQPVTGWSWFGQYNAWQAYRERIFMGDIKRFLTRSSAVSAYKPSFSSKVKDQFGYIFAMMISGGLLLKWLVAKPEVIIYSVDKDSSSLAHNDQRINFLYETVVAEKISYSEFWHSLLGKSLFKNAFARRRLGLYIFLVNILASWRAGSVKVSAADFGDTLNHLTPAERDFAVTLLGNFYNQLAQSEIRIRLLVKILRLSKAKNIWAIDNTRDYQEVVVAAKMAGIPFYAFQHGHFTKYHLGWLSGSVWPHKMATADKLFVWSDYWEKELVRLGSAFGPEQIVIGGVKNKPITVQGADDKKNDSNQVGVLIPFETEGEVVKIKQYIDALLADETITVYFKLRPDVSGDEQLAQYDLTSGYHPRFIPVTKTEEVLNKVNVVAGTYSTFLYDMVAFYKPLVLLKTGSDFGEGLVVNGLATMLDLDNSLVANIRQVAQTPMAELETRLRKLNGSEPKYINNTLAVLAQELKTK